MKAKLDDNTITTRMLRPATENESHVLKYPYRPYYRCHRTQTDINNQKSERGNRERGSHTSEDGTSPDTCVPFAVGVSRALAPATFC